MRLFSRTGRAMAVGCATGVVCYGFFPACTMSMDGMMRQPHRLDVAQSTWRRQVAGWLYLPD